MLNLDNPLFVFPSLLILMSLVACLDSGGLIRGSVGVEHPHIKKCSLESATAPQIPLAATSSLAFVSPLALKRESVSPVKGCRVGSIDTS